MKVTIDGIEIDVPKGTTILQAARMIGSVVAATIRNFKQGLIFVVKSKWLVDVSHDNKYIMF
jgi:hypothetical protein